MTSPAELLALAVDIACEAGELAHRRRAAGVSIAATKSALADIVTEADREVEQLIRARLLVARPDDGFLGEESDPQPAASGLTWVVDPIDGTVNYACGIPFYAVSIAVVEGEANTDDWTALAGAVFNPAIGELFTAARGAGAHLGGARLQVNRSANAAGALLATGFGYDPKTHAPQLERIARAMPLARDLRRLGAASLDLAYVAAGRLDGYFEKGLQPWDHAAGALLVSEAGGLVGGAHGHRAGREMVIAAAPELYAAIERALVG